MRTSPMKIVDSHFDKLRHSSLVFAVHDLDKVVSNPQLLEQFEYCGDVELAGRRTDELFFQGLVRSARDRMIPLSPTTLEDFAKGNFQKKKKNNFLFIYLWAFRYSFRRRVSVGICRDRYRPTNATRCSWFGFFEHKAFAPGRITSSTSCSSSSQTSRRRRHCCH